VTTDRSDAKDFEFFMSQGNFMKVVDTLEKYQQRVVNTKSESGKEFVQFKRQLYQMYEVQNRSIDEHDNFSNKLERQNLRWLYQANLDYIGEVQRVSSLDALVDHGQLKGSVFRAKMLNAQRMRGIGSLTLAGMLYSHMTALTMMMGPVLPVLSVVGTAMYGLRAFSQSGIISKIDYVTEGEFNGLLRATIQKSPLVSYTVILNPKHTMSICSVGADDVGEDDAEGNIIHAKEYFDESTGIKEKNGLFTVPADAYRDKITMEWIMASKNEDSQTDALFNDMVQTRHQSLAATGGLTGIRKFTVEQTGYANFGDEEEINLYLKNNAEAADETLVAMTEVYGQETLEKMKPSEFYRLYKDYPMGKE